MLCQNKGAEELLVMFVFVMLFVYVSIILRLLFFVWLHRSMMRISLLSCQGSPDNLNEPV